MWELLCYESDKQAFNCISQGYKSIGSYASLWGKKTLCKLISGYILVVCLMVNFSPWFGPKTVRGACAKRGSKAAGQDLKTFL